MRLRALFFLLVLTAGDYALWGWSIAYGHDILSLVAGLTLLPLAAVSLGGLVLAGARLLRWLFGRSSPIPRAGRGPGAADGRNQPQNTSAKESNSSSSRIAA